MESQVFAINHDNVTIFVTRTLDHPDAPPGSPMYEVECVGDGVIGDEVVRQVLSDHFGELDAELLDGAEYLPLDD